MTMLAIPSQNRLAWHRSCSPPLPQHDPGGQPAFGADIHHSLGDQAEPEPEATRASQKPVEPRNGLVLAKVGRLLHLVPTLTIAALSLLFYLWGPSGLLLEYDRHRIADGELWRVLTGHLVHWNTEHLFWDVVMFTALGCVCHQLSNLRYALCLVVSSVAIPVALMLLSPQLATYRGLSGLDTALFVLTAVLLLRQLEPREDLMLRILIQTAFVGLAGKIGYEYMSGETLFVDNASAGFAAVPLAHLVGAAVGGLTSLPRPRQLTSARAVALVKPNGRQTNCPRRDVSPVPATDRLPKAGCDSPAHFRGTVRGTATFGERGNHDPNST